MKLGPALRDAGISALIAFGLFGLLLGTRLQTDYAQLLIVPRPVLLGSAIAVVFVGRFAMRLWADRFAARRGPARPARKLAESVTRFGRYLAPLLIVAAVTLPLYSGRGTLDTGNLILHYVMLGWGLNIVVGLAGLLDLGYVAFYAIGAYTFAIGSTTYGLGFWECLPLGGLFAAFAGILLGFPVLRLRGDYLAIVTLAFGEIIRDVLQNWTTFTSGTNGISVNAHPTLFGLKFTSGAGPGSFAAFFGLPASPEWRAVWWYYIILALAFLTNWVSLRLRRQPLGRAWEALREDEIACRALGINVTVTKLTAFAMGATFAGFAGVFFANRQGFVNPESFTYQESALILAIVVLGGLGSQLGVALAAVALIGGTELFRSFNDYRVLVFGLALVIMMILRPRGLISGRTPSVSLGQPHEIAAELVAQGRG